MEYYLLTFQLTFELWEQGPNYCTTLSCSFFSSGANMITSFCHFSMQLILLSCKCKLPCHMAFLWKWRRVYKLCRHERLHVGLHYFKISPRNLLIYDNKNLMVLRIGVLGSLPLSSSSSLLPLSSSSSSSSSFPSSSPSSISSSSFSSLP